MKKFLALLLVFGALIILYAFIHVTLAPFIDYKTKAPLYAEA